MDPALRWRLPLSPLLPLLLLLLLFTSPASSLSCDGSCSGHGACDRSTGRCQCFPGYVGVSCKWLSCPEGTAWVDMASATDTAHALAECSNMGTCDRATGTCKCAGGFDGPACERMACPPCTNGRCISQRDAAQLRDDTNFFVATTYSQWDADKIFGCQCDPGFSGWDCSLRVCPRGDDPVTTTPNDNEVQHLNCRCDDCSGSFALTFRRRTTRNLAPTETAASLKLALEALDTIEQVTVSISNSGAAICDTDGATTSITFTHNPGNLPDLVIQNRLEPSATVGKAAVVLSLSSSGDHGLYDGVAASVDGTREEVTCSDRGNCDTTTGVCSCLVGFASSDGAGGIGARGDCGYMTAAATCPVTSNGVCDGKGACSGSPFKCTCIAGFTGADCTQRSCPTGAAWFDGATAAETAHAMAECSNRGTCDTKTGLCSCQAPFTGSACGVLKCPVSSTGAVCNGHGACKTMKQLALAATTASGDALGATYGNTQNLPATWDAEKIQGCQCTEGYYLGPYADAFGEFGDYDCSARFCPLGADPYEEGKVNEVQTLSCQADGGTLQLTFRTQTTAAIAWDATAAVLKAALEKLSSVYTVTVTIAGSAVICDDAAAVETAIEFTYEQGDLPMMTATTASLTLGGGAGTATLAETRKGTKANIECSSRGICDRATGVCKCFNYFLSSDGAGNLGTRGDCGYLTTYATQ